MIVESRAQAQILNQIMAQRARFLRFLQGRVEDLATAEDILQSAYLRALERGGKIHDGESVVAWFYRILRNAAIDHYRRRATRNKAEEVLGAEWGQAYETEVRATLCACIEDVIHDLKPEYRQAIEQVDLAETPVEAFAESQHISANNASVRLHRARKSVARRLRSVCGACAEHKCLDCTCRRSQL
jgi:RNA polymerase sigma-70 factor (ECF subfamily)